MSEVEEVVSLLKFVARNVKVSAGGVKVAEPVERAIRLIEQQESLNGHGGEVTDPTLPERLEDSDATTMGVDAIEALWDEAATALRQLEQERDAREQAIIAYDKYHADDMAALRSRLTELEAERDEEHAKRLRDNAYSFDRLTALEGALRYARAACFDNGHVRSGVGDGDKCSRCLDALLSPKSEVATSGQNKLHMTTFE